MKLTTRLKRGRKSEWWVLEGGRVRTTVAEISRELTGGVVMQYRPYLHMRDKPGPDGESYYLRQLAAKDTLDEAIKVVAEAMEPKAVTAEATDRVTFIGVGMTQEKADQFAAGIRRRITRS